MFHWSAPVERYGRVAVFLSFLVPLGAVLLMPAAVAGGALLSRRALGQPIDIETVRTSL